MRGAAVMVLVMGLTGCTRDNPGGTVEITVNGPVVVDMARAPAPDLALQTTGSPDLDPTEVADMAPPAPDLAKDPGTDMAEPAPDLANAPAPDMTPGPDMTPAPPAPDMAEPPCGALGQACCAAADQCPADSHLNCVSGVCESCRAGKCYTCGTDWLPPCEGANKCAAGYVWMGDGHGSCMPCGGRGQPCCNQRFYQCPPSPNLCWTGDCYQGSCNGQTLFCQ